jgi:hypothetical protein
VTCGGMSEIQQRVTRDRMRVSANNHSGLKSGEPAVISWTRVELMQLSSTQCRFRERTFLPARAHERVGQPSGVFANALFLLITTIAASAHAQRPWQSRAFVSV